jgi:hypothetical protein
MVAASVLPHSVLYSSWFTSLSVFVAVNTVVYVTLAIIKLLPKAYLSDWFNQRNRRTESRSIYPDIESGPPT